MAKKNSPYFDDFITMSNYSCDAADYLLECLTDFDLKRLDEYRKTMHDIEHSADSVRHDMMHRLVKEFVTPIEREDIIELINALDNVTDTIDDILIRIYMYNIDKIQPAAIEFVKVIVRCCKALQTAMQEFPNFQKSTTLNQSIIDVNSMEDEGDRLYIDALHELYKNNKNPIELIVWSEIFDRLEECCDACEDVADLIEIVVTKNS